MLCKIYLARHYSSKYFLYFWWNTQSLH